MEPFRHHHRIFLSVCPLKTSQKKLPCKLKRNTCSLDTVDICCANVAYSLLSGQRHPITHRFRSCSWDVFVALSHSRHLLRKRRLSDSHKIVCRYAPTILALYLSQALDRLVLVSCTHCCASTPSLSTLSSSRGLTSL